MKLRFAISVTQVIGVYTHTDVQKLRVGLNFNVFEKKVSNTHQGCSQKYTKDSAIF